MARIENQPKVFLSKEEIETINKTRKILSEIGADDTHGDIYDQCDNFESEWWWIDGVLENLINISEEVID